VNSTLGRSPIPRRSAHFVRFCTGGWVTPNDYVYLDPQESWVAHPFAHLFFAKGGLPFASYLRLTGKWRNQLLESWRFYGRSLSSYSSGTSSCETSCVRTSP